MHLRITVNPLKALLTIIVMIAFGLTLFAQDTPEPQGNKISLWITNNWPLVGLVISEALAFVPAKFAGITKAVFSFFSGLFSKKSPSK